MSLAWEGLALERPAALLALLAPLALWLVARARPEPPALATGAFPLWRELGGPAAERTRRARREVPPAIRLALLALALGALAAAGPRLTAARAPRTFVVVVDASPSMSLPLADGTARLDAALRATVDWLAAHGRPGDRVLWRSSVHPGLELPLGVTPPPDWLAPPSSFAPEPDFAREDRPGTLWVTDRVPFEPTAAGCSASGGPSVPGPVATAGRTRIDWDGSVLVEVEDAVPSRPVAPVPSTQAVPRELAELLALWARERGFGLDPTAAHPALVLEAAPAGETREVVAGRDGWTARGTAIVGGLDDGADPLAERWLEREREDGARETLVLAAPGRVRLAWTSLAEIGGDPAAFALSWSTLFDRSVLPPPGIVPLAERADAGAPRFVEPEIADEPGRSRADAVLEIALALAAGVAALAAASVAGKR
jgi:hypothetical protein